jgi:hypothetical protein
MTTIVNTPSSPVEKSDSGMGIIFGFIVLAVVVFIFFVYGLPAIRKIGSPQINIPSKIDLNINQPNK